jgi:hypothetical protein
LCAALLGEAAISKDCYTNCSNRRYYRIRTYQYKAGVPVVVTQNEILYPFNHHSGSLEHSPHQYLAEQFSLKNQRFNGDATLIGLGVRKLK